MLALSRKVNESIMLGNDIEVTVLEIKGDQVKIGIKAPKNVTIFRKEIYVQIEEENKKALRGELGRKVASQLRIVPEIDFLLDTTLDYAEHIDELLRK